MKGRKKSKMLFVIIGMVLLVTMTQISVAKIATNKTIDNKCLNNNKETNVLDFDFPTIGSGAVNFYVNGPILVTEGPKIGSLYVYVKIYCYGPTTGTIGGQSFEYETGCLIYMIGFNGGIVFDGIGNQVSGTTMFFLAIGGTLIIPH